MTAISAVKTAIAVANPDDPTNATVPFLTHVVAITAVTANGALLSPPVLALVAGTNGNANVCLQNSPTTPVVLTLTKGVPMTGIKVIQVRTTSTTCTMKGLY